MTSISAAAAFSIFREWKEKPLPVVLLSGSVQDAPTQLPPGRLANAVVVSEPDEIILRLEGKLGNGVPIDLRGAKFAYANNTETSGPASGVWIRFIEAELPSGQRLLFGEWNRS